MNRILVAASVRQDLRTGRVERIRRAAGLSQTDFGTLCGVSAATVSRWEAGARVPRLKAALRIHRVVNKLETAPVEQREAV